MKLNLSGHKNDALEKMGFKFPGTIHLDMEKTMAENSELVLEFLKAQGVDSQTRLTIAMPGHSELNAAVLVAAHGLTGTFPIVVPLRRTDAGFAPGESFDLQAFRNNVARTGRDVVTL